MFNFSRFSAGFVIGFGTGFVSRDLMSSGPSIVKPVIKGFMKAGVNLLEKSRESIAGFAETIEDLLAEVRSEQVTKETPKAASKKASTAPATATSEPAKAVKASAAQKA